MERVEARLLLLVCLERVASLEIGVLHDCAPDGPGESKRETRNKEKESVAVNKQVSATGQITDQLTNQTLGRLSHV